MATRNSALKARIRKVEQRAGASPQIWEIDYISNWREHAAGAPPVVMARRIIIIGSDEESAALPDALENSTAKT